MCDSGVKPNYCSVFTIIYRTGNSGINLNCLYRPLSES